MATIKLKSSTGTRTVPSSLAQGEMAINVADGNLFYGDNSSNVNNDFGFAQVSVTGLTSGATTHATTLSAGTGGVYGTLKGQVGTDAAPVTAYINGGEIDGVTLGSEATVAINLASTVNIVSTAEETIPLSVKGFDGQSVNYFQILNAADEAVLTVPSTGRLTTAALDCDGGSIDGTTVGSNSRSTGKFTTLDVNSTLVVTGNTVMNGTLSATTSLKVGNGDGTISANTLTTSSDITSAGDVYTDVVRRQSDSSTTTKIKLDDETVKTFGGSSSLWTTKVESQKLLVGQGGAGVISANTINALNTLSAATNIYAGTGVDDGVISANTVQGSYSFITFLGNAGSLSDDNWQIPGTNGISNHTWGTDAGADGTTTGSSTISISRTNQMIGIRVPAGARLVGVEGVVRSNVNDRAYAGLFTYLPDYEGPNASDATLRILAQTPTSSNNVTNDPQSFKLIAGYADQHVFADGECIIPGLRRDSSSSQTLIGSFTIILKY